MPGGCGAGPSPGAWPSFSKSVFFPFFFFIEIEFMEHRLNRFKVNSTVVAFVTCTVLRGHHHSPRWLWSPSP